MEKVLFSYRLYGMYKAKLTFEDGRIREEELLCPKTMKNQT